jgi:type IX secretion system PorP/SprF family membrane protein
VRRKITRPSREGRVGLGGYVFNDKNGIISRTGFQMTYAYHIPMDDSQLSFGISANAFQFSIDEDEIVLFDLDDPLLMENDMIAFVPDVNFGVSFHTQELFVGISATQLLGSALKLGKRSYANYKLLRHYFIMGGYKYEISPEIVIQPSILMKSSNSFRSFQVDLNVRVFYMDDYWAGLSYRTNDAMVIMAGLKVSQYYFGYAFDYSLSNIRKYSFGSHEFVIAVKFGDNARRYRWLNRY